MLIAKIGEFDITPLMIRNSYSVNDNPIMTEWTDGRGIKRYHDCGTSIAEGSFKIKPRTQAEYVALLNAMRNAKRGTAYEATLLMLNTNGYKRAFYHFDTDFSLNSYSDDRLWLNGIKFKVTETAND